MPVTITTGARGYRASTPSGVKSKQMTVKKAKSQQRLLNALDRGDPRPMGMLNRGR